MKLLIFSLFLVTTSPLDIGHTVVETQCQCAKPFKATKTWTEGARGGYNCMATSKSGKQYKRYFSQWVKLKK